MNVSKLWQLHIMWTPSPSQWYEQEPPSGLQRVGQAEAEEKGLPELYWEARSRIAHAILSRRRNNNALRFIVLSPFSIFRHYYHIISFIMLYNWLLFHILFYFCILPILPSVILFLHFPFWFFVSIHLQYLTLAPCLVPILSPSVIIVFKKKCDKTTSFLCVNVYHLWLCY